MRRFARTRCWLLGSHGRLLQAGGRPGHQHLGWDRASLLGAAWQALQLAGDAAPSKPPLQIRKHRLGANAMQRLTTGRGRWLQGHSMPVSENAGVSASARCTCRMSPLCQLSWPAHRPAQQPMHLPVQGGGERGVHVHAGANTHVPGARGHPHVHVPAARPDGLPEEHRRDWCDTSLALASGHGAHTPLAALEPCEARACFVARVQQPVSRSTCGASSQIMLCSTCAPKASTAICIPPCAARRGSARAHVMALVPAGP